MKTLLSTSILTVFLLFLTNCSGSIQTTSSTSLPLTSAPDSTNTDQNLGNGSTTTPSPLDSVNLKGAIDSTDSNKNALAFDFDKSRGEFIIMIPMPSGIVFTPVGSFTSKPDITFSPIMDANGKLKFGVRIPIKYILKGVALSAPSTLPNGSPLPAMPAGYGELPSLALNFPQHNNTQVTLYIGVNAVGLFVTLPANASIPLAFSLPIKNSDKTKTLGYLSYVPQRSPHAPGLFVSTLIPPKIARILEDHFHL